MATSRRHIDPAPSGRDWRFETIEQFEALIQGHLGCLHWYAPMSSALSVAIHNGIVKVKFINEWPGSESDRSLVLILERQCQVGALGSIRMGAIVIQSGHAVGRFQGGQWTLNDKVPVRVQRAIIAMSNELQRIFPSVYQG